MIISITIINSKRLPNISNKALRNQVGPCVSTTVPVSVCVSSITQKVANVFQ